ncbi:MAG TPA: hypothetical protein VIY68_10730 [Steroidobacteraceae bacterium]
MHQLSDIVTAPAHLLKPMLRNGPQLDPTVGQPRLDRRILSYSAGKPEDLVAADQPTQVQRNATRLRGRHEEIARNNSWSVILPKIGPGVDRFDGAALPNTDTSIAARILAHRLEPFEFVEP